MSVGMILDSGKTIFVSEEEILPLLSTGLF